MCMYDVCAMCMYDVSVCVSEFWGKSTHFDGKTTRFGLQIQIPTRFQTISLWGQDCSMTFYPNSWNIPIVRLPLAQILLITQY